MIVHKIPQNYFEIAWQTPTFFDKNRGRKNKNYLIKKEGRNYETLNWY